jgi:hypothetical protein
MTREEWEDLNITGKTGDFNVYSMSTEETLMGENNKPLSFATIDDAQEFINSIMPEDDDDNFMNNDLIIRAQDRQFILGVLTSGNQNLRTLAEEASKVELELIKAIGEIRLKAFSS